MPGLSRKRASRPSSTALRAAPRAPATPSRRGRGRGARRPGRGGCRRARDLHEPGDAAGAGRRARCPRRRRSGGHHDIAGGLGPRPRMDCGHPRDGGPLPGSRAPPICSTARPTCSSRSAARSTKLVVYYQGGGACWNYLHLQPAHLQGRGRPGRRRPRRLHERARRPRRSAATRSATGTASSSRTAAGTSTGATTQVVTTSRAASRCTSSTAAS